MSHQLSKPQILSLDFSEFLNGTGEQKRIFSESLLKAFSNLGFVKIINHGIGESTIQELLDWNRRFFSLDLGKKMKSAHPPQANPHRGYSYVGQEKLSMVADYEKGVRDAKIILDVKESFDQGCADDELYPNIWPIESDIPDFREFMETFYERCHILHLQILHALELALELEKGYFERLCDHNTSELRLNHYPACDSQTIKSGAANRISEHTDFGTVTLLFQDSVGGLEVEDQHHYGTFIPVEYDNRAEIVVNIGDCLQRWTNNALHSANHRVKLPQAFDKEIVADRYSAAYFAKPNRTQHVNSLEDLVRPGSPVRYNDALTAWEYNQAKLVRTY